MPEPTLFADDGAPETVYLTRSTSQRTNGWFVTSLDVGSGQPLAVGDRLVALNRDSPDEFLNEREAAPGEGREDPAEAWLRSQVPPHHGGAEGTRAVQTCGGVPGTAVVPLPPCGATSASRISCSSSTSSGVPAVRAGEVALLGAGVGHARRGSRRPRPGSRTR